MSKHYQEIHELPANERVILREIIDFGGGGREWFFKIIDHCEDDHLQCLDIKATNGADIVKFSINYIDRNLAAAFYYPENARCFKLISDFIRQKLDEFEVNNG